MVCACHNTHTHTFWDVPSATMHCAIPQQLTSHSHVLDMLKEQHYLHVIVSSMCIHFQLHPLPENKEFFCKLTMVCTILVTI